VKVLLISRLLAAEIGERDMLLSGTHDYLCEKRKIIEKEEASNNYDNLEICGLTRRLDAEHEWVYTHVSSITAKVKRSRSANLCGGCHSFRHLCGRFGRGG
jgi:hypothetical protein